ncbi:MAG: nitronate monooxygenase [Clostridiaceae bacterium]|nr:nitronate monooxygenase [Clostridiaceae bacterium]
MKLPELHIGDLTARLPIVQGGMGVGISLSGLAGAVAAAGGVGTISGVQIGFREPDFEKDPVTANLRAIGKELQKARERSPHGIIGFNFMSVMKNYALYVREAVRCGADFIVSGAGLPFSLPELTKGSTVKILPIVSSARACRLIVGKWLRQGRLPDAVVVEGPLAGGHLGFKYQDMVQNTYPALEDCVAEVRAYLDTVESEHHVSIPVIAGGGLAAHEDVCRMLSLGAAGVQLGTRFVATEECDACPAFKQAYLNACEEDIRIIKSPVGLAARAISNPFLQMAEEQGRIPPARCYGCMEACSPAETKYCISSALFDAANDGSGLIFCGAGAAKLHELTTVPRLLAELSG